MEPALSDHKALVLTLKGVKFNKAGEMYRVRNFSIENFENFQWNLLALKKITNGYYENPDDLYSDFAKMFKSIYEQSFPWKKVNRKRKT